ncbi:MAG TPA: heme-binding protein [Solirubrobacteraceae bacterium]|nr:heme-binding protein [Solirubrobacteraceae bacterium]
MTNVPPRHGQGPITTALNLGPLASLPGSWRGTGFNVMWRPDNSKNPAFDNIHRFLELNLTSETLDFRVIPGVVPNRGAGEQEDLSLYGLHYLQRVSDADVPPVTTAREALHIEPGLFMNVPASDNHKVPTIVRMGAIPHGVSVLMQGRTPSTVPVDGPPHIPAIYPLEQLPKFTPEKPLPGVPNANPPIEGLGIMPVNVPTPPVQPPPPLKDETSKQHPVAEVVIENDKPGKTNGPFPPEFQKYIENPNKVLSDAIAGQDILGTITIELNTEEVEDSIGNIPFLGTPREQDAAEPANNAFVQSARATFWLEWVRIPNGKDTRPSARNVPDPVHEIEPYFDKPTYLQLQYSQSVILVFNNVLWPHITVATLTLSAG